MPEQLSPEAYEIRRAGLVREIGLMDDVGNQEAYDWIARLAKRIFGTDIVLITFMDSDRQWFKSHLGTDKPFVLGGPQIRFYAGEPSNTHDGHPVGTICLATDIPVNFRR